MADYGGRLRTGNAKSLALEGPVPPPVEIERIRVVELKTTARRSGVGGNVDPICEIRRGLDDVGDIRKTVDLKADSAGAPAGAIEARSGPHAQHRFAGRDGARGIGHRAGVAAGIGRLDVGQGQPPVRRALQIPAVEMPLET